jgi:hypothetical protein
MEPVPYDSRSDRHPNDYRDSPRSYAHLRKASVVVTAEMRQPREIDGKGRTVRDLLAGRKYSIDYYQREYKWQTKHVSELIDDLADKFLDSYEAGHERAAVERYGHYFVGSIIVSDKAGRKFIIDGQQRLTTITLLLIYLQHRLDDKEQRSQVAELIFSQKYGKRSFNLDIPERTRCMEALYSGSEYVDNDPLESVVNILGRYADIDEAFLKSSMKRRCHTLWTG